MTNKKPKKRLNNNAIGLLLVLNLIAISINIVSNNNHDDALNVVYASANDETIKSDEKRRNSDNDSEEEVNDFDVTYNVKSVVNDTENAKGFKMYVAFKGTDGIYFTYAQTKNAKEWHSGYWYASNDVLKQANYNIDLLHHNDELTSIYVIDNANGDYLELVSCDENEKAFAYKNW